MPLITSSAPNQYQAFSHYAAAATGSDTALLIIAAGLVVAIALLNQLQGLGNLLLSSYTGEKMVLSTGRGSSAMSSASRSLTTILGARLTLRTASNTMPLRSMDRD